MAKLERLPRYVRFGPTDDDVVEVLLCPQRAIQRLRVEYNLDPNDKVDGTYIPEHRKIMIDKSLSIAEQWATLRHELVHCFIDEGV